MRVLNFTAIKSKIKKFCHIAYVEIVAILPDSNEPGVTSSIRNCWSGWNFFETLLANKRVWSIACISTPTASHCPPKPISKIQKEELSS